MFSNSSNGLVVRVGIKGMFIVMPLNLNFLFISHGVYLCCDDDMYSRLSLRSRPSEKR